MAIVLINPSSGGNESGSISGNIVEKNYNLDVARMVYDILKRNQIETYLIRDDDKTLSIKERLDLIKSYEKPGVQVILLTIMLATGNDNGAEIIYSLRNNDNLAVQIANSIESLGYNVLKYYQLRDPKDTSLDYYEIIREPFNTESIIVSLGYIDNPTNNNYLLNNKQELSQKIADGILKYLREENIYVVKSGDTLFKIANQFGVSVNDIKNLNNLFSDIVNVGERLIIPNKKETASTTGYLNYTVKSGDSLYSIAREYNTTVNTLKEINNLTSNNLSIGQILKIPSNNSNGNVINNQPSDNYINYTVKSGDSLYRIAISYNTTVDAIKKLNNLASNNLSIGQILKIPSNNSNNDNIINNQSNDNYQTYTVKSGDSLYRIAISYNTTADTIKKLNNLASNNLSIGQILKIPSNNIINNQSNDNYINYTVKSGDSLYRIAISYNTTVDAIKKLNNLTSNNLSIGQILKMPR